VEVVKVSAEGAIEIKLRNVKKWRNALKVPEFRAALRRHLSKATLINAKRASARQRQIIQSSAGLARNAALTVALKGENKPLVGGGGDLFQAITEKDTSSGDEIEVFSGVLRTNDAYNIGAIVHEGATIQVTEKMRGLFFMLWVASKHAAKGEAVPELQGRAAELFGIHQNWFPLSEGTKVIVIPPRNWIAMAFGDPGLKRTCERNWLQAIQRAMRERLNQS
jgi:hypothetical protein